MTSQMKDEGGGGGGGSQIQLCCQPQDMFD